MTLDADPVADPPPGWDLMVASVRSSFQRTQAAIFRLLCLSYSPKDILNCRRSFFDTNREIRANAAELMDNLVPRKLWRELLPILFQDEFGSETPAHPKAPQSTEQVVVELAAGDDAWVRACALNVIGERRLDEARATAESSVSHADARVCESASRAIEKIDGRTQDVAAMTVVEKVVALQGVEVFRETPPEQLAQVASVAREVTFPVDSVLCKQDEPPGDLFVLLDGKVALERDGGSVGELGRGDALGTWGLFEDEPWTFTARTLEETRTLRIDRWGFEEVLDEHPEIARSLIQQLIRRLRKLAGVVKP